MTENQLKIEAGKRYVQRNGAITRPLTEIPRAKVFVFSGGEFTFTADGHFRADREWSPLDLVAEYIESPLGRVQVTRGPAAQKTLRDEFAMAAMAAILESGWRPDDPGLSTPHVVADMAYATADAMLKAREVRS